MVLNSTTEAAAAADVDATYAWLANRSITFVGDSTALRMFIFTVNELVDPRFRMPYGKVADAPQRTWRYVTLRRGGGAVISEKEAATSPTPYVLVRFFRMMFISTAETVFPDLLGSLPASAHPHGGHSVFVTAGNWDLNWKLQKNMPMPGLDGAVHSWPVAQKYWTKYVEKMFGVIGAALPQLPPSKRPNIVFREQYLPNCAAPRFSAKTRRYRQCGSLIRPVVVPFYRRALTRVAWELQVPVVPGFVADRPQQCTMSDGVHLDAPCMAFELQLLLNVGRMLTRAKPSLNQGNPALEGRGLPDSADFAGNVTKFASWWKRYVRAHALTAADRSAEVSLATLTPMPSEESGADDAPLSPDAGATDAPTRVPGSTKDSEVEPGGDFGGLAPRSRRSGSDTVNFLGHVLVAVALLLLLGVPLAWVFR